MNNTRRNNIAPLWGLLLAGLLAACEAPLDLSGVEAQLSQPLRRSDLMQAVARHQDTVIAVGGLGTVVVSEDGGASWQRNVLPGNPFLVGITSCPDGAFHAVDKGDGLWSRDDDGGWSRLALPELTEPQAIACDPAGSLWVIGGFSTILHSADLGASWESWSLDEDLYLTTIQFIDGLHAVATGEFGTVLVTDDGGENWVRATALPDSFYPQSAHFTGVEEGWVVGLNGTIWKTADGGQSWQSEATGTSAPLYGIGGSGDTLVAVGENSTVIRRAGDAAAWSGVELNLRSHDYLRGVAATGDGRFVVVGGGGVVASLDPAVQAASAGEEVSGE